MAESDVLIANGALYGMAGARSLFGDELVPARAYVALSPGVNPDRFAASLQGSYLVNGAEASSIRSLMQEAFSIWDAMFQLFQGYLGLGLIVGIAGLAVVMVRAVRERRREIGMLRALGFGWRTVGRSFAIESGFIAVEGTLIGGGLALLTISNIVANTDVFGALPLTVPWVSLLVLLAGTVIASLLATAAPAIQATRIKPAVALRTVD
jgi:putative ABC transport system permease protein